MKKAAPRLQMGQLFSFVIEHENDTFIVSG